MGSFSSNPFITSFYKNNLKGGWCIRGENGLTASDVALLNNDGMGGNGWGGMIWLFAILAMMGGGFGFGGGYRPQ